MTDSLTIRRPDDWHLHFRDDDIMRDVVPYTARQFARAIVMATVDASGTIGQGVDITTLATAADVATNAANIATNTANITTNTGNIATNTANITTNTGNIATNTANIATNTAGIATNAADIATNTANITANATAITALDGRVTTNETNIATNTANITTNANAITALDGRVTTNETNIATNTANIATNTGNIATNTANIATNTTNIATNTAGIATNAAGIATNATNIAANGVNIAALQALTSTHTGQINTLFATTAANTAAIDRANEGVAMALAMTQDNQIIALSADDGSQLWNESGSTTQAGVFGVAAPAAGQGTVIAGYSSGELTAYRYENGRTLWADALARTNISTQVGTLTDIDADPIIDSGRVYALGQGGRMRDRADRT